VKQYLDIVKNVLENGKEKFPVRKNHYGDFIPVDGGVKTITLPNVVFSHDMKDGFPLLTTKKIAWKTMAIELEGFIKGITDKSWYKERGCKIWNFWANPLEVEKTLSTFNDFHDSPRFAAEAENDLGPIYGYQWRNFGEHYGEFKIWDVGEPNANGEYQQDNNSNGVAKGCDQLQNIVDTLRVNPMDRRMVCSAWNPNQMHMMALPPCHLSWIVSVIGDELNLAWTQRSCDLMLGVPFNIASYGLLLTLLAKTAGLKVGNLTGLLVDCHIYENQIDSACKQVDRKLLELPTIKIPNNCYSCNELAQSDVDQHPDRFDIFKWNHTQLKFDNYSHCNKLSFGDITV